MVANWVLILSLLAFSQDGSTEAAADSSLQPWPQGALEALERIRTPEGVSKRIIAAGPLVRDPVAFAVDHRGRAYVCESERQEYGVEDNRSSPFWLQDDLALQTVDDRLAMYEKHKDRRLDGMGYYSAREDRLTCLSDEDGDGIMDTVKPFTDPFAEPLDGTLAGVLVDEGTAWITNIPHLWIATDENQDGQAESRRSAQRGFGVRIALRGHDMHGLVRGPDGRIYFSIGDRGFYLQTADGRLLHDAGSGAVFRCEPDGSALEVVHVGLRNPQELAFNDFGDLFTGDNNSDAGDRARIVQILPGGETGWRMEYQTLEGGNQRGPWNQEGIWQVEHPLRPRWASPPITYLGSGPSGLVYHPGTGFRSDLAGSFFMCDFRGDPAASLLWRFRLEPDGAGYRLSEKEKFIEGVLCTDVDFTPNGALWISAWGGGWVSTDRGRLFEFTDSDGLRPPVEMGVQDLLTRNDLGSFAADNLAGAVTLENWLGSADRRVRQRIQNHLASGGEKEADLLVSIARGGKSATENLLGRIHALWGLEQWTRRNPGDQGQRLLSLASLEGDPHEEVRRQLARVIGDGAGTRGKSVLIRLLEDPSPRVRSSAALALAKLGVPEAREDFFRIGLEAAADDPVLHHSAVMALAGSCTEAELLLEGLSRDSSKERRMLALLALRKKHHPWWLFSGKQGNVDVAATERSEPFDPADLLQSGLRYKLNETGPTLARPVAPSLAHFLNDADPEIVAEAARAIHDLDCTEAMTPLADLLIQWSKMPAEEVAAMGDWIWPTGRRVIDAAQRHGGARHLMALVEFAGRTEAPDGLRRLALQAVAEWDSPPSREGVRGLVRPVEPEQRPQDFVPREVIEAPLGPLLKTGSLKGVALKVALVHGIELDPSINRTVLESAEQTAEFRIQALEQLQTAISAEELAVILKPLVGKGEASLQLRMGEALQAESDRPTYLMNTYEQGGELSLRQLAIRRLAQQYSDKAGVVDWLVRQLDRLDQGEVKPELTLDVLRACEESGSDSLLERALSKRMGTDEDRVADHSWALAGGNAVRGQKVFTEHPAAQCLRCHQRDGNGGVSGPGLDGLRDRRDRRHILQSIVDPSAEISEGYSAENGLSAMPEVHWILEPEEIRDLLEYLGS